MVFDGGSVARIAAGRARNCNDQFHRALWTRARRGVSFGACGGGGRGVVGSMAPPAVAVLGNVAAGGVYVRVNNLGAVSLRGGRFRWNSDGNARLRDRQMDDEDARRIGDRSAVKLPTQFRPRNSIGQRGPEVLRARTLENLGDPEQDGLARHTGHDLQTNGQSRAGTATGG